MPWRPLPTLAFAICVHPFRPTEADDLPLQIGDQIYIIERGGQDGAWYRGYLLAPPSLLAGLTSARGRQLEHRVFSGIFPRNCVQVRELVGEGGKARPPSPSPVVAPADGTGSRRGDEEKEEEEQAEDGGEPRRDDEAKRADNADQDDAERDDGDTQAKRKSQADHARRLSRALTRKRSTRDIRRKDRRPLIDPDEPMPRDPDAPKPLAPVPLLRVGDETGRSAEEPLVDEIASCLREWHDARLHELLLARGYGQLARVQALIGRVDTSRKQLMHDVMTARELVRLREDSVWDLVAGNKMLDGAVIVRNPADKGRILTADDSVIDMTKLQANMSILDRPPKAHVDDPHMLHHVLVDVRNLAYDADRPATLLMYLCRHDPGDAPRPVSESYAITAPLPDFPPESPADLSKTLFVNLSAADVGIGAADLPRLFVVFKLIKEEPVRIAPAFQPARAHRHRSQQNSVSSSAAAAATATAGGDNNESNKIGAGKTRRGVFGSQRKHSRSDSQASTTRPNTGRSDYSELDAGAGASASEAAAPSHASKTVKRTVAIGAVELGKLARQRSELQTRVTLWAPCAPAEDGTDGGASDDWVDVVRELAPGGSESFRPLALVKRLDVFAAAFASADLEALVRNTPTLLHDVTHTEKLGFSGVPHQKRSDIYLTLSAPVIAGANPSLKHAKHGHVPVAQACSSGMANLQLTLEVRKADGERVMDCIFTASNHSGHTAWRTTGIERGEAWNQTIKLAIPAEHVPGSHIVMSIADSPEFPFALAWIPLWEGGAFVRDGDHQVALYVYDEYSSSMIGGVGAYLALPPWHKKEGGPAYGSSATVSVRTYLCSTEYSQDPNLLGLLGWREHHGAELLDLLARFSFVPEIEIVKLLADVLAALFEILDEYAESEAHEDVVFHNFVVIMGIAQDRRFNLGTRFIQEHAATLHDWPHASRCLLRAYHRLVTNPLDAEASRKLRATLKVGDQMLKLIVETSKADGDNAGGDGEQKDGHTNGDPPPPPPPPPPQRHPDLASDLQRFFVAVMALMRNGMPVLLGTQTLVVQNFHSWLPELAPIMSPAEIMETATDLLDACAHAQGRMILHRLVLVLNYSHLEIFRSSPEVRLTLIANTFRWLSPYWGDTPEVTEQWRDQVRLCCSVVAAQMEGLGEESCQYVPKLVESYAVLEKVERAPKRTFSMLFPSAYPFPRKGTQADVDIDEGMLEISALLAAALTSQSKLYFDAHQVDIPGVLLQALKVARSILGGEAFPENWLSLHVSHHRFAMGALERIADVLVESLPDVFAPDVAEAIQFDTNIWRAFFDTLFAAVTSPALGIEAFPEQKRRAVWKIAGDVREAGAQLLRRSWNAIGWETEEEGRKLHGFERLGGYQVQFVPELVAPVVELCLSVHAGLRGVAVEVLRSMIISNWEIEQDLAVIQSAMIDCLDRLCRTKHVTESMLQKTFLDEMVAQFAPLRGTVEEGLHTAVLDMFARIEELLGMLATVHQGGAINEASKIVDTLRLMEFLRDVQSDDAYVRYVHQLADLQAQAGNHTEAGLALELHADRYGWDPSRNVAETADPKMPAQTAFERKEALYFDMCGHFERGQAWQRALLAYKELAEQYESNVFDFSKLARAQRAMAAVHDRIAKGDRASPRYFRVVYKGLGFPITLRDKEFVVEGLPTDRQAHFEERLQQLHPAARILRGNGEEAEVEGQFLRVFAVSPNKDLGHPLYQRTRVSQAAREHCLLSSPRQFTTSSRQTQRDVGITDQVVEKTVYTTAEAFPTILRRSEIVAADTVALSPIQAAIERTSRKTLELLALERHIVQGNAAEGAMDRMSEDLLLSVDPDSDSSVSRYRSLLPDAAQPESKSLDIDYDDEDDEEGRSSPQPPPPPPLDPIQNALRVALLDHALAIRRCLNLYSGSAYSPLKAELVPRFEATFEHELAILFPHRPSIMDELVESPPASPREPTVDADADAAAAAAATDDEANGDDAAGGGRRSRRRSLSFLRHLGSSRRRSSSRNEADGERSGRSTSRRRASSRTRDNSITRRLSFFRSDKQRAEEANGGGGGGGHIDGPAMELRKRLSLLNQRGVDG